MVCERRHLALQGAPGAVRGCALRMEPRWQHACGELCCCLGACVALATPRMQRASRGLCSQEACDSLPCVQAGRRSCVQASLPALPASPPGCMTGAGVHRTRPSCPVAQVVSDFQLRLSAWNLGTRAVTHLKGCKHGERGMRFHPKGHTLATLEVGPSTLSDPAVAAASVWLACQAAAWQPGARLSPAETMPGRRLRRWGRFPGQPAPMRRAGVSRGCCAEAGRPGLCGG